MAHLAKEAPAQAAAEPAAAESTVSAEVPVGRNYHKCLLPSIQMTEGKLLNGTRNVGDAVKEGDILSRN